MSNTAPSRADPMVVFPLSRWCPPQETSQPHPPPATATGDFWTTKVSVSAICFIIICVYLSGLRHAVISWLVFRQYIKNIDYGTINYFQIQYHQYIFLYLSLLLKHGVIYIHAHTQIYIYICTYVWIFVCFCWGLNKYYSFKLQQILFHLFCFIHIAVHVYWFMDILMTSCKTAVTPLLMHLSYCNLVLSYQFNV